jgi:hypothetical protein
MPPLILNPTANDLRKTLSPRYMDTTNIAWGDLAVAFSNALDSFVDQPRRLLTTSRDFTTTDIQTVLKLISMLGLDYTAGLYDTAVNTTGITTNPSGDARRRLIQGLAEFWSEKGNPSFVDFIGFILNVEFTLVPLWTKDFITFVPLAQVPDELNTLNFTQYVTGHYYPTSYVGLSYDGFTYLKVPFADIDPTDIATLFYKIAPIHLVLDWIAALFSGTFEFFVGVVLDDTAVISTANREAEADLYIEGVLFDKASLSSGNVETLSIEYIGICNYDTAVFNTYNITLIPGSGFFYIGATTQDVSITTTVNDDCSPHILVNQT